MAATKNVPAKAKTTAVATYEDRLASMAQEATTQEESVSSGSFLSVRSGQMTYQGNPIKGNELDIIILDSILENCYYEGRYDPDNPAPPVCYAFGRDEDDLKPHEKSSAPQHETCKGCPNNEFGSADTGKGKACKNTRRLALIPGDDLDPEKIMNAEIAYMKLPVTSVKGWASYVRSLSTLEKKPPLAFVTTVSVVPDAKTQFKVVFAKAGNLEADSIAASLDRHDEVKSLIDFPYPETSPEEEKPARKQKPAARGRKY